MAHRCRATLSHEEGTGNSSRDLEIYNACFALSTGVQNVPWVQKLSLVRPRHQKNRVRSQVHSTQRM